MNFRPLSASGTAGLMELIRSYFHQRRPSPKSRWGDSCINRFEALLSLHSRYGLHARQVAYVTLYTGGSGGFVSPPLRLLPGGANQFPGGSFLPQ
jgi:hypothetical protein